MKNLRPIAFVLGSTNHGTMILNRFDYRLTPNGGGFGVGYQLLNQSAFDPNEVHTVVQLLLTRRQNFGPGVVAVDCGANIGVHTIEWAQAMHGWGEVIAIEAQERIFYALAGNITINNCFNAQAIFAAVGAQDGELLIPAPDYLSPSSFGSLELKKTERTEFIGQNIDYAEDKCKKVRLMTLDSLNLKRLDLIKIDIEGMEMEALNGAKKSIAAFKPIMTIEKIKSNEAELRAFLEALGYNVLPFGMNILAIHSSDPATQQVKPA